MLDDVLQTDILEPEVVTEEVKASVNQNESPVINEMFNENDDVAAAPTRVIALFFYDYSIYLIVRIELL